MKQVKFDVPTLARSIVSDARILSGDDVGPSSASWQDVAGTLATNMAVMSSWLHNVREGKVRSEAGEVSLVAAILAGTED